MRNSFKGTTVLAWAMLLLPLQTVLLPAQKPNDTKVAKRGPDIYEISRLTSGELRLQWEAEIREWIWTHFYDKKPGTLRVTYYSLEGDRSIWTYTVRPDPKGNWHIAVHLNSLNADRRGQGRNWTEIRDFMIYQVERYPEIHGLDRPGGAFPTAQMKKLQPFYGFTVVLKDKHGNVVVKL